MVPCSTAQKVQYSTLLVKYSTGQHTTSEVQYRTLSTVQHSTLKYLSWLQVDGVQYAEVIFYLYGPWLGIVIVLMRYVHYGGYHVGGDLGEGREGGRR
jgi:hypothetical protein